jgi:hypothetical protein
MSKKIFAFGLFFAALLTTAISPTGCYYDNEVEQYGVSNCDTAAISYSRDILPIINANCISCHTPGGQQESTPFTNHTQIKDYSSTIVERVNGEGGIMPPSGAISSCDQLKIEAWVNAGAPNN